LFIGGFLPVSCQVERSSRNRRCQVNVAPPGVDSIHAAVTT
jgi:hypothetical protein